jgi:hypothetical protein
MQAWHIDVDERDWLTPRHRPLGSALTDTAAKRAIAIMHSHTQTLRQWIQDFPSNVGAAAHVQPRWRAPRRSWRPHGAAEPLLLILEDDGTIGNDTAAFVRRVGALLALLRPLALDAVNLLSDDVKVCRSTAPTLRVKGARAAGFDLSRPIMATSRTRGALWSLRGAQRTLAHLPCSLMFDLYIRHLLRINALAVINSCDGLVRGGRAQCEDASRDGSGDKVGLTVWRVVGPAAVGCPEWLAHTVCGVV